MKTIILTVLTVLSLNLVAQKTTYRVDLIKSYVVNEETGESKLANVSEGGKYIYINTQSKTVDIPYPGRDARALLNIIDCSVDYDDGYPMVYFKTVDKYGKKCDIYADGLTISVGFDYNGASIVITYFITKL